MHAAGSQVFAVEDIGRIHPERILLLSPVKVGGFALDKASHRVVGGENIILNTVFDVGIYGLKPLLVSCYIVYLPCSNGPYNTVCRYGPTAAGAGVLDDTVPGIYLSEKTVTGCLSLDVRHGKKG